MTVPRPLRPLVRLINRLSDTLFGRYLGLFSAYLFLAGLFLVGSAVLLGGERRWIWLAMGLVALALAAGDFVSLRRHPEDAGPRARRLGEYWWLGVALPLGFGAWATFAYLAYRLRRTAWAWCALVYFLALVSAGAVNVIGGDSELSGLSLGLYMATWGIGILHAYRIRNRVRPALDRLAVARDGGAEIELA